MIRQPSVRMPGGLRCWSLKTHKWSVEKLPKNKNGLNLSELATAMSGFSHNRNHNSMWIENGMQLALAGTVCV